MSVHIVIHTQNNSKENLVNAVDFVICEPCLWIDAIDFFCGLYQGKTIPGFFQYTEIMIGSVSMLLQNSIACGFSMPAYSYSGRFLSRFRLMPMRDFVFRLVVSVFHTFSAYRRDGADIKTHFRRIRHNPVA